jgi:hypothetical protein
VGSGYGIIEVMAWHLPGGTEENHDELVSLRRFEAGASRQYKYCSIVKSGSFVRVRLRCVNHRVIN